MTTTEKDLLVKYLTDHYNLDYRRREGNAKYYHEGIKAVVDFIKNIKTTDN